MRLTTVAAASLLAVLISGTANAIPISDGSTINFTGSSTFTNTQVNFSNPADLKPSTGDFAALGICTGCVTVATPLIYSPFTAVDDLFSVSNGGLTATVDITSQLDAPFKNASNTALIIRDNAVLSLTGKDDTPGILTLTVNQATGGISGSFSATGETVVGANEPMSLALMGLGLAGLGMVRARKQTSA